MAKKQPPLPDLKIKYVKFVNGRWVFRPYIKKNQREGLKVDRFGYLTPIKLGVARDPEHRIRAAHATALKSINIKVTNDLYTVGWLSAQYKKSKKFKKLAPASQKRAENLSRIVDQPMTHQGKPSKVAELHLKSLTKPVIRRLMEKRLSDYKGNGRKGESQVNREISYLSAMITWGLNYFDEYAGLTNPCKGIEKFEENVNERYVTDSEYALQMQIAESVRDYLPIVFEITYLTATRGIEALNLKFSDIIDHPEDGRRCIKTSRRKGSKDTFIFLSPRLEAAIDAAKELHKKRKVTGIYIVPGPGKSTAGKLKKGTLDTAMQHLKNHMNDNGYEGLFWTLHDLKRKGISDADDKKIAGQSPAMQSRYDTKIHAFEPPK